ncbi:MULTISPECIES: DUF1643 domain-containing protein [unclassified Novosphingobium]|uniref:DUF1643 domain-containing protein n=1 Tax=unclassified Novosphingobium TaxID=2644732 RepID=UPI000D307154|nr:MULTISPECIES: DUF1643 domain-containing protein [unclassified Novosphingobium]
MGAIISPCGAYRYRLERRTGGDQITAVIMVNPSTADAEKDDATIRKLLGFGQRNGWGRVIVGNLFAYRATDVRELARTDDPVGPENDAHLRWMIGQAKKVICAWSPVSKQPQIWRGLRWRAITNIAQPLGIPLYSIGQPAQCGHPKHPLMLPYDSPIVPWSAP